MKYFLLIVSFLATQAFSQLTDSQLYNQLQSLVPNNTSRYISPANIRTVIQSTNDARISVYGNSNILGKLTYSSLFSISNDADLVHKKYVDDAIAATSGGVTSFNTRTGAVVATSGDYTFSQIGSKPTTLSGYGITDAYPLTGNPSNFHTGSLTSGGVPVATGSSTLTTSNALSFNSGVLTSLSNSGFSPAGYYATNSASSSLYLLHYGPSTVGANNGFTLASNSVLQSPTNLLISANPGIYFGGGSTSQWAYIDAFNFNIKKPTEIAVGVNTYIPLIAKGAPGQVADLQNWSNNSGAVLASVNAAGEFAMPKATVNSARVGGALYTIAGGANSGTGLTTLDTYSVPAMVSTNGDALYGFCSGYYGSAGASSKTVNLKFAGVTLYSFSVSGASLNNFQIEFYIQRISSSTAKGWVKGIYGTTGTTSDIARVNLTGLDFTTTNSIAIEGQGGASNEVILESGKIKFDPN